MSSGNAKAATRHFKHQRMSAILLVPLVLWFVITIAMQSGASHAEMTAFLSQPINAVLMGLCIVIGLFHFALGLEAVIDDYIQGRVLYRLCYFLNRLFAFAAAAAGVGALVKIIL